MPQTFTQYIYFLPFLLALALSAFSIPNIIYVTIKKRLFDQPDHDRKVHNRIVPNLGGVGIFFSFVITTSLFSKWYPFASWPSIMAAIFILFASGLKDDLVSVSPMNKLFAQLISASIVVMVGGMYLNSLHGLFGIHEIPVTISMPLSIIGITFVTNALNLIDGLDGLAGTIGLIASLLFGAFLVMEGQSQWGILAFALAGAIAGFLIFNIEPAKVFMGDNGALVVGFFIALFAIEFVNDYSPISLIKGFGHASSGALGIALAVIIVPVFDTCRVFATRVSKGHSPFMADRTHLHHYLLDIGFSHTKTVIVLGIVNIAVVGIAILVRNTEVHLALAAVLALPTILLGMLIRKRRQILKEKMLLDEEESALRAFAVANSNVNRMENEKSGNKKTDSSSTPILSK